MNAADAPLAHWLRLLWNRAPALHLRAEAPFIAAGAIHLPPQAHWQQHRAAAAHAAAHLVFSPARFEAEGLVPTARALLALLEDARVEALAMRELPGLARLWRPLHTATPDDGNGCEPLMGRLARALADPAYQDPHPWVAKGRRLFYLHEPLGLLALRTPAELREAALRLGHDIGQMRLPFNAKGYRPAPGYRDDHRWMWPADQLQASPPPPQPHPSPGDTLHEPDDTPPETEATITRHPEWDRLIGRLRADWASVHERRPPGHRLQAPVDAAASPLSRRLQAPLRALTRPAARRGRSAEGELFHLGALVDWRIARRLHAAADARVYRGVQREAAHAAVWLLVDASASTADALRPGGPPVLQAAAEAAQAIALALQAIGVPCAVAAFRSNGRHAVRLDTVLPPGARADTTLAARLQALRSGGSTRLGAALRHAAAHLAGGRAGARWVLLLSDGEPHDVDVHDPRYLVDDARQAVRQAARQAVRMACLTLADKPRPEALRIFGAPGAQTLVDLAALPRVLQRLVR